MEIYYQIKKYKNFFISFLYGKRASISLIKKTCLSNKLLLISLLFLSSIQSLLEGLTIYIIYKLVSIITTNSFSDLPPIFNKILNLFNFEGIKSYIFITLIFLLLAQFLQSIVKYLFAINTDRFTIKVKSYIREFIYKRLLSLNYSSSSKITTGRLLNLTIDVPEAVRERIEVISNLLVSIMLVGSYIFILTRISAKLFLIVASFQFLIISLQLIPRNFLEKYSSRKNLSEEKINSQLTEEIKSLKYLQSSGIIKEPLIRLRHNLNVNIQKSIDLALIRCALFPFSQFMGIIVLSIITILSLYFFNSEKGFVSEKLVVFIFTLNRLNGKISEISDNIAGLSVNNGILNILDGFLDNATKTFRLDYGNEKLVEKDSYDIQVKNIRFKYDKDASNILNGINLSISQGDFIGVIGEIGSGKTTFLDLILNLITPCEGDIFINGKSLRNINSIEWQNKVGLVSQNNFIFSGSIYENINLYSRNANKKKLDDCIKIVNLDKFVESLEQKGDTLIGEGARELSGGQKQKINIARALYRNPKVLILDEATSSQDYENEKIIEQLINRLKGKITIITVAHRLNLIRNADRIYAFDQGKIIEYGDHEELIAKKGYYYNLLNKN